MIALDASGLIAHLAEDDPHHERATDVLLATRDEQLCASPLTLAEVLVLPAEAGRLAAFRATLDVLEVQAVPLADDAPERLALLRAETRLKLPDCCVLLAAEDARARGLLTFDTRLAAAGATRGLEPLGAAPRS